MRIYHKQGLREFLFWVLDGILHNFENLLYPFQIEKAHRIIEWFRSEMTLKTIYFQSPCHGQDAQGPIQLGLEQF